MRKLGNRKWPLSAFVVMLTSLSLGSCSAPDRLSNSDINTEATKKIVRDRLISPIDNERITEFNEKIPRRSILQVIHGPESLSDPNFLQIIESQLEDEIDFKKQQKQDAGIVEVKATEPRILTDAEKDRINKIRGEARAKIMFDKGLALETYLFGQLRAMETQVDEAFLKTVPLNSNVAEFPPVIGANLTEDPNGYLSLPADLYLIGGRDSAFISKTAAMAPFVDDGEFNLAVRSIPLQDVLMLLSDTLNLEYSLSRGIQDLDRNISISLRANALSILDALLTQHSLAILYDSDLGVARFYTDEELVLLDARVKAAIRGHNELLFNQKNLRRAESDLDKINQMIDTSQLLLSGDDKGFVAGIKGFPRSSMGQIATDSLSFLSTENFALRQTLQRFDEETASLLDPSMDTVTNEIRAQSGGISVNDILVEDACIEPGKEIFVEKIAIYNADRDEAREHLETYFNANSAVSTGTAAAASSDESDDADAGGDNDAAAAGGDDEAGGEAAAGGGDDAAGGDGGDGTAGVDLGATETATATTNASTATNTAMVDENGCDTNYQVTFQTDNTGIIIRGRRYDNSLAVRLMTEFDVPRLQVLVEIFMVTVSRDFNRQIANLITQATNNAGGSNTVEAEFTNNTFSAPSPELAAELAVYETLGSISNAISRGYVTNLSSPNGLITSALSFIESNELGRVLSSPTILVEDGTDEASIVRKEVAKLIYTTQSAGDNGTLVTNSEEVEEEAPFELTLTDISVSAANKTVRMGVNIKNKRFKIANLQLIEAREDADYTEDTIQTVFTAAPGDVIVLAGLTDNSDSTITRGLPGTTGALGRAAPLLGGSDQQANNVSEMLIFMAPTVIDPSSDFQPHSAFKPLPDTSNEVSDNETASE